MKNSNGRAGFEAWWTRVEMRNLYHLEVWEMLAVKKLAYKAYRAAGVEQRQLAAKLTAHAIENVRLRKLLDGAPHLESCPLHGVANTPIADRLHLCRCFYRQTIVDDKAGESV